MRLINAAHLTAFMALYEPALLAVVSAPDRSGYAYGPEQVPQVAAKMSAALASGSYNHDGAALKRTCRALAIPHTRKAIEAYLTSEADLPSA